MPVIVVIIYLIIGFFVTKAMTNTDGEVRGALIFLWPLLLLGIWIRRVLNHFGLYSKWIEQVFVSIVAFLVVILLFIHFSTLFKG